ncbi:cyclase family protein [Nocardioides sambongensis]|uniref:cyclase family protein n=1 Tax=Nocardioides sambongensis TaxID=2589074 RepID=UPI00112EB83F|nr:cyclase family protein [Nocardioides sambongensis]
MTEQSARDFPYDRTDPAAAIAEVAEQVRNWGRWGDDDRLGTLNLLTAERRAAAAALVRTGESLSLSLPFDMDGPQNGWRRRTNPVHTMLDTGTDAVTGVQGFPHGIGGADDVIAMPLQCSTQWDGLGHIFDRGKAWNGRPAEEVVTALGDGVTGIEHAADVVSGRGVLLDVGRALGPELTGTDELPDGFAITPDHLEATIEAQGLTAEVGTGDLLLVRTGHLTRARRGVAEGKGWGGYAGGPAPGLSFTTAGWLHAREVAAVATDTWGFEVRPNEFDEAFQPLHQVCIPNMGLTIGEMWDLDALSAACVGDGRWECLLVAGPLRVTGAVGAPLNPIALR